MNFSASMPTIYSSLISYIAHILPYKRLTPRMISSFPMQVNLPLKFCNLIAYI